MIEIVRINEKFMQISGFAILVCEFARSAYFLIQHRQHQYDRMNVR